MNRTNVSPQGCDPTASRSEKGLRRTTNNSEISELNYRLSDISQRDHQLTEVFFGKHPRDQKWMVLVSMIAEYRAEVEEPLLAEIVRLQEELARANSVLFAGSKKKLSGHRKLPRAMRDPDGRPLHDEIAAPYLAEISRLERALARATHLASKQKAEEAELVRGNERLRAKSCPRPDPKNGSFDPVVESR